MNQPDKQSRWLFFWSCTVAGVLCLAATAALASRGWSVDFQEDPLETVICILGAVACAGGSVLFAAMAMGIAKGPPTPGVLVVRSGEWGALAALAFCAVVSSLFSAVLARATLSADAEAPWLLAVVATLVGGFAAFLVYGTIAQFLFQLRSRTSRVILQSHPTMAGSSFEALLEIPYPVERAPVLAATLTLVESDTDTIGNSKETILWSQETSLERWSPHGRGLSVSPFRFHLPPPDFTSRQPSRAYTWQLHARSTDARRPYAGTFLLPIAFEDPVAEGVIRG